MYLSQATPWPRLSSTGRDGSAFAESCRIPRRSSAGGTAGRSPSLARATGRCPARRRASSRRWSGRPECLSADGVLGADDAHPVSFELRQLLLGRASPQADVEVDPGRPCTARRWRGSGARRPTGKKSSSVGNPCVHMPYGSFGRSSTASAAHEVQQATATSAVKNSTRLTARPHFLSVTPRSQASGRSAAGVLTGDLLRGILAIRSSMRTNRAGVRR